VADSTSTDTAKPDVVDRAEDAADGLRKSATWIATALGGIPSLAVLGSLIREPGKAGFDSGRLALGIGLALAGAVAGIIAFGQVLSPVPVDDAFLETEHFDIQRVPGHPFVSARSLKEDIATLGALCATRELGLSRAKGHTNKLKALAAAAASTLAMVQAALAGDPNNADLKMRVAIATADRDAADARAAEASATQAIQKADLNYDLSQLSARNGVRDRAFRLAASDEVRNRYNNALNVAVLAVGLVAAGVFFLATAPIPDTDSASGLQLVTLAPNALGKEAIGCEVSSIQALKIGGSDSAPLVITLPSTGCEAKVIEFTVSSPSPMGSIQVVSPVPVPSASSST
jgi:hypothetical protein